MRRSLWVALLASFVLLAAGASVAARHAPGGLVVTSVARGTLTEEVSFDRDNLKLKTRGPVDVVTIEASFERNGGSSGWHVHPGAVFVVIRQGTLSVWDEDCVKTTYSAGQTFFEEGPGMSMLVKNESTDTDALVYGTFIVPVGAAPLSKSKHHRCGLEG